MGPGNQARVCMVIWLLNILIGVVELEVVPEALNSKGVRWTVIGNETDIHGGKGVRVPLFSENVDDVF